MLLNDAEISLVANLFLFFLLNMQQIFSVGNS